MSAPDIASILRTLAAMRTARGQTYRGSCLRACANEILELSPAEMAMVGLNSLETTHAAR